MNLKQLTSPQLIEKTKNLAAEERKLTTEILWCLREVESRMLFAELGYSSIYEFAVKHLHYSEGSAHRRISAMRLLATLPTEEQKKTEEKLNSGELTLTNVSLLQNFLKTEKKIRQKTYSSAEKSELLNSIENQSKRETEKILGELQPAILIHDKERPLNQTQTEITFIATEALMQKLNRIRELIAHQNQNPTYAELFEKIADLTLIKLEKCATSPERSKAKTHSADAPLGKKSNEMKKVSRMHTCAANQKVISRTIPTHIKKLVWARDQGTCTYQNKETGIPCKSRFGLEYDHIQAFGMGGEHSIDNLRLRCRAHNQLHAIQTYGPEKMGGFKKVG